MRRYENLTYWTEGLSCCDTAWEAAYNRFESEAEEKTKFLRRLKSLGVAELPRHLRVADLFCGRGGNLAALEALGFEDVSGVDLSPELLHRHKGRAKLYVGDCRDLHFADGSKDLVIAQGGLHHLPEIPADLSKCFAEAARVLSPGGIVLFVEPCNTPFLRFVHTCCNIGLLRRAWPKLDALAEMIEREKATYFCWLSRMRTIRSLARDAFDPVVDRAAMGKWYFVGRKK